MCRVLSVVIAVNNAEMSCMQIGIIYAYHVLMHYRSLKHIEEYGEYLSPRQIFKLNIKGEGGL